LSWKSALLTLICFCLPALAAGQSSETIVRGDAGARLDAWFSRITPYGFSGAVLVARDGEVILNRGYGLADRARALPNAAETIFCIGSITKQFTAAALLKLEMQGKLHTDDPLSRHLEGVPEDKAGLTLHHLLTHSSGLVQDMGPDYAPVERDSSVRRILSQYLEFAPGARFEYSNVGYTLLAAVVEKVSGRPYEQFLREELFLPAGMEHTGYRLPDWNACVVARNFTGDDDNGTSLERPFPYWNLVGNGGILSTTMDMYRWHEALLGETILSAAAKRKIFTPYLNDYGYGWDVLQTPRGTLIQHNGGGRLGNNSEMRRYVDAGVVTILLCNQTYGGRPLVDAVRDQLEALAFGEAVPLPPEAAAVGGDSLGAFAGYYGLPDGGEFQAEVRGGLLWIIPHGQAAVNRLAFPGGEAPPGLDSLNALAARVVTEAFNGNFEPLGATLKDRERRFERVRGLIENIKRVAEEVGGGITHVRTLGTTPSPGPGTLMTVVELNAKGLPNAYLRLFWKDGKNVGIASSPEAGLYALSCLPLPQQSVSGQIAFAGYHLARPQTVNLAFKLTPKGNRASALILLARSGEVIAGRLE